MSEELNINIIRRECNFMDKEDIYNWILSDENKIKQLQQENKELKNERIKVLNRIKDLINLCECEIIEGSYSNDKHSEYYTLFKKELISIKNLIKNIDENELLDIEERYEKKDRILYELESWLEEGIYEPSWEKGEIFWNYACELVLNKLNELRGDEING